MTRHLKRHKMPKQWSVPRKGTKFIVRPSSNKEGGIPILILLRDLMKIAQTKREVKKALHKKYILLNHKPAKDEKHSAVLFDVLTIVPSKKSYRVILSKKGKFDLEEIKDSSSEKKVSKIVNKKVLKGKKVQLNLSDGRNILSNIKCEINDSVLINLKNRKIDKCLPLVEKAKVVVFAGKHTGKIGNVDKIKKERHIAKLNIDGNEVNVLIKQLMVVA